MSSDLPQRGPAEPATPVTGGSASAGSRVKPLAIVPDADALAASLAAEGWTNARMDRTASLREALVRIGQSLHFPDYYGVNLDALTDCLRDLPAPTALVWRGWQQLAVSDPEGWARLVPVLRMGADGDPRFAVLLSP